MFDDKSKMFIGETHIKDLLSASLNIREAASHLFDYLKKDHSNCEQIELDFEGVEFMSRAFADQFHKERIKFQEENNCRVILKNIDYTLIEMLDAVSKTQDTRKQVTPATQSFSFNNLDLMSDYIFAW